MYEQYHIDLLNEFGMLSVWVLMRRYKITKEDAKFILNCIIDDHENVYLMEGGMICIQGRELDSRKKKSKWIDITKP